MWCYSRDKSIESIKCLMIKKLANINIRKNYSSLNSEKHNKGNLKNNGI